MARIEITPASLVAHVEGLDRILAFKTTVNVPWEHVVGADRNLAKASAIFHGLKLAGTGIPGVITAGSFLQRRGLTFWDVHDPAQAIIVRLRDEHYEELVVGVDDPEGAIREIGAALHRSPGPDR
ncbi:MAG: hypothetical protein ACREPA_10420 [Candidatus Dormibacteraceae bacterium]